MQPFDKQVHKGTSARLHLVKDYAMNYAKGQCEVTLGEPHDCHNLSNCDKSSVLGEITVP